MCKSQLSRTACYDLLGELVRGCTANYTALHQLLIAQQVREEGVQPPLCGTLSNNVVSLDCEHVSTTTEEFYTVRCQVFERFFVLFFLDVPIFFKVVFYILIVSLKVAEMRSLYQSLEEVCVKDMLKGDNKYTCSQCGTKVFILFSSNSIFSRFQASFVHDSFLRCERKREPALSRCRTFWLSTRCATASTWSP